MGLFKFSAIMIGLNVVSFASDAGMDLSFPHHHKFTARYDAAVSVASGFEIIEAPRIPLPISLLIFEILDPSTSTVQTIGYSFFPDKRSLESRSDSGSCDALLREYTAEDIASLIHLRGFHVGKEWLIRRSYASRAITYMKEDDQEKRFRYSFKESKSDLHSHNAASYAAKVLNDYCAIGPFKSIKTSQNLESVARFAEFLPDREAEIGRSSMSTSVSTWGVTDFLFKIKESLTWYKP